MMTKRISLGLAALLVAAGCSAAPAAPPKMITYPSGTEMA